MDNLVFEESVSDDIYGSEFISKKWTYVNDNNVGNYSNQIVIDSTPLANSGQYVGWNEAYILMPLVVQLTADAVANLDLNNTVSGTAGDQTWAFKNGFWQMIHSMSVEFNNGNAVQQFPFLNVFSSFKAQTSFSDADVFNHGDGIGFYMDSADSWTYQDLPTASNYTTNKVSSSGDGVGLCNNKNMPPLTYLFPSIYDTTENVNLTAVTQGTQCLNQATDNIGALTAQTTSSSRFSGKPYPSGETCYNKGMRERQLAINRNTQSGITASVGYSTYYTGQDKLIPISTLNQVWATYQLPITTQGIRAWNIYAKLRLKDLADFFHKVPLLKGSTMRFIMNTNQAITSFQATNLTTANATAMGAGGIFKNTGLPTLTSLIAPTAINIVGGMTNPLMLASNSIGQGSTPLPAGSYKLSVSIVKCNFTEQSAFTGLSNTALQSCRLYAPLYKMNPTAEKAYLSLKTKRICYKDVISYQFTAIPSNSNFNILVSQGLKNICSVLTVPLIASTANAPLALSTEATGTAGSGSTAVAISTTVIHPSTLMSPFTTTGATPDPIVLNNYNVAIAGVNVFLQDEMYDFEAFKQQLISSNQLNGNLTTGLTSGLINEKMFSYLYRYYYANCERTLPTERDVDRSVQVKGRNLSTVPIDLLVFVEVMREMVIDLETGARVG